MSRTGRHDVLELHLERQGQQRERAGLALDAHVRVQERGLAVRLAEGVATLPAELRVVVVPDAVESHVEDLLDVLDQHSPVLILERPVCPTQHP